MSTSLLAAAEVMIAGDRAHADPAIWITRRNDADLRAERNASPTKARAIARFGA